ncbi:HAD family hydrolase [Croceicoccus bisphenolivorans]|uniref:HAD family hydrolase n=1 Tax=Croceicoccus bisphenolivorans TaxID=1783232 RepID=UPI000A6B06AB|nr:HAD-IB family phosphatase [Croceicoccus bisphenolivorans]
MKRRIAIYDLDGTLLKRATFTPFLLFAARRRAVWRLALAPVWVGAMIGYKAGLYSREALKGFGLRLMVGRIDQSALHDLACAFADSVMPSWIARGAAVALERDRAEGRMLVLATAAMAFYAGEIARRIGFDHVIATRHADPAGDICRIAGGNCYGTAKVPRVETLLADLGIDRADCDIRFYSDSLSDAPLLDWADEGVLVNGGAGARRYASTRNWVAADFR